MPFTQLFDSEDNTFFVLRKPVGRRSEVERRTNIPMETLIIYTN